MLIRAETAEDCPGIDNVNHAAFGNPGEAALIRRLRADGVFIASLVAIERQQVIGHILLSKIWIVSLGGARYVRASLAPMAVLPHMQRHGIGSALVLSGIQACREAGHTGIIVVGHPHYYPRFGFSHETVAHLETPYPGKAFMGLELVPGSLTTIRGRVVYPSAFAAFE